MIEGMEMAAFVELLRSLHPDNFGCDARSGCGCDYASVAADFIEAQERRIVELEQGVSVLNLRAYHRGVEDAARHVEELPVERAYMVAMSIRSLLGAKP